MYIDGTFASFQQRTDTFSLKIYFSYRSSFVQAEITNFPSKPQDTQQDIFLKPVIRDNGFISYMYGRIFSEYNLSLSSIKTLWEQDLGEVFDEDRENPGLMD